MGKLTKTIATTFLRSTSKGTLTDSLPPKEKTGMGRVLQILQIDKLFRLVGRLVGLFLTPSMKARIQEFLINRYRIEVTFQPEEALQNHFESAWKKLLDEVGDEEPGDYLEFGVYQGDSLLCMNRAMESVGIEKARLFGFDSFEGLPDVEEIGEVWSAGQFRSELDFTKSRLSERGIDWDRTILVKGFFSDSLTEELLVEHSIRKASIVMVDSDLYSSAVEALTFCADLLADVSVIFFDDWHSTDETGGEQKAFREFLEAHPEFSAEEFGGYHDKAQSFVVRRLTSG